MADLTVTPTSVVRGANAQTETYDAGETIAAGKTLYLASATKKFMLADSNSATLEARVCTHIALNGGALNQPITAIKAGDVTIGATLVAGSPYYLSETPGGIQPAADLASGENVNLLGLAKSTTVLAFKPTSPGVVL